VDHETAEIYRYNKAIHIDPPRGPGILERVLRRAGLTLAVRRYDGARAVVSEQIIEYPLLFRALPEPPARVLDFGCVEGVLPLQLAAFGYEVTAVDFRPYAFAHPAVTFVKADILTWEPPPASHDAVVSISTVEHVGLGGYGDPVAEDGDCIAVRRLLNACRPSGLFVLTVPAGEPTTARNYRVYDEARVRALVPGISSLRFFIKPERYGAWVEAAPEDVAHLRYDDYEGIAPAQGVAFVLARAPA
jgi:2-polyprenyl-3-methyl-5-hydroxy-6-metoxy-1,4-benzoquinol methylase